jgi:ComF family protein
LQLNRQFYCVLCKKQTNYSKICENCKKKTALKAVFVVANYNNQILQNLLHNLKYNFVEEISDYLSDLIIKYLELNNIFEFFQINSNNTILCPVPLHKKRYLARGFNQSELLAQKLNVYYKIPQKDLLIRQINTISQISLNRQERQINLKNAFVFNDQEIIKNKKILLIDDVVTTGSTLIETAWVLEQKGFNEIYGLVIAQRDD